MRIETEFGQVEDSEWSAILMFLYRKRLRFWMAIALVGLPVVVIGAFIANLEVAVVGGALIGAAGADVLFVHHWIRKWITHPDNTVLHESARAVVDEEAIVVETESGISTRIPWRSIIRIEPFQDQYILLYGQVMFAVVFRKKLSIEDWKEYEALVIARQLELSA